MAAMRLLEQASASVKLYWLSRTASKARVTLENIGNRRGWEQVYRGPATQFDSLGTIFREQCNRSGIRESHSNELHLLLLSSNFIGGSKVLHTAIKEQLMATVSYAFFSYTGNNGDLVPGAKHFWSVWGGSIDYGDAIAITAHPVSRPGRALAVEDLQIVSDGGTPIVSFAVKNVGSVSVPGYGFGITWVDQ